jgi:rSAM/selenodomain-associated transferase 2
VISVVIPVIDEAERLPGLLQRLAGEAPVHEVIVVDGGSLDDSAAIAARFGARVLKSAPGRGIQLRAGGEAVSGDIILFLHADSGFPAGGLARLEAVLSTDSDLVGGNFRVIFDGDDGFSRWLTGFYAWFCRRGLYYGDSAIFVRTDAYRGLGGIKPLALMEDYEFTRRLERHGETVCVEDPALITSSRRFEGRHPVSIVWGWLVIHALFYLGVGSERLARIYDSDRRRRALTREPKNCSPD